MKVTGARHGQNDAKKARGESSKEVVVLMKYLHIQLV
jgi:hypothetical protein